MKNRNKSLIMNPKFMRILTINFLVILTQKQVEKLAKIIFIWVLE